MTLPAPSPFEIARQHLLDGLGANYGAATDVPTLDRALLVDATQAGETVTLRPWATAARLIRFNTEYEVDGDLRARIDRKLAELEQTQRDADASARGSSGLRGGVTWGDL